MKERPKIDLGMTGYDELFMNDQERAENRLPKIHDIPLSEIQLGYLSVCPPKELPQTTKELNALGFLRVMSHGEKWDYLVQIDVQSKRTENSLAMKRIGYFPDAASPNDEMESSPEVTMPLFSGIDSKTGYPRYEDAICRFYRWYGVGKID